MNTERRGIGYNVVPKRLGIGQLAGSAGTIYTAPTTTTPQPHRARIRHIVIANTDSSARTFTLYVVESGGSAADNRALFKSVSIAANTTYDYPVDIVLEAGDTVQGLSDSANKVTYYLSGEEMYT